MGFPLSADEAAFIKAKMRTIADFPKPGIRFKDLATLLIDGPAMQVVIGALTEKCRTLKPDHLALLESRGFLFTPIADRLGIGSLMLRKPGKLPGDLRRLTYDLEYGQDTLTLQKGLAKQGDRVLIVDDLLATGGTAGAAAKLLTDEGYNVVGAGFVSELSFLSGRSKFPAEVEVFSLVQFDATMS